MRLLIKIHLIGFKFDTAEQLKRKGLCCGRFKTMCALLLPKLTAVIKMYVASINWATGVFINFVILNPQNCKMRIITGSRLFCS